MKINSLEFLFFGTILAALSGQLAAQPTGQKLDRSKKQIVQVRGEIFTTRTSPVTLPLPKEDGSFHFAIYGDRTGGNPSGLRFLREAVKDTNLLDPDLVMTVGDLIQGYNKPTPWMKEMEEYKAIMNQLNMNWFPVAGNHDIYWDFNDKARPAIHHEGNYENNFGPLWYSFEHKDHGFIVLYTDEGDPNTGDKGFREARVQNMSPEQLDFLSAALERLKDTKKIFVFLHHPRWLGGGYAGSNWPEVHQRMAKAGNVAGVFAGHIHHLTFDGPVDGIEYYTLGATGAHLAMDSPELGYLHHFNIVTVRDDSFTVSTIPVGAVIDPKTFKIDFLEDVDLVRQMRPARAGNRLAIDQNSSSANDYAVNISNPGQFPIEVTITPKTKNQWQTLPDHRHVVIPPGKSAGMKFHFYRAGNSDLAWADFVTPTLGMSVDYLHSSARIRLPEVSIPVDVALETKGMPKATADRCLKLRGKQSRPSRRQLFSFENDSARVASNDFVLPQGPITIEAWVNPSKIDGSRAIAAKTDSAEYALFLHNGYPEFNIHLDGRYMIPRAAEKISTDTWTHVAGVFDGQQAKLFLNGKLIKSIDASGTRTVNELPLYIGADPDGQGNPTREFAGLIDEFRLSSTNRYTAEFVPQKRFEPDNNTVLLLHFDQLFGPFVSNGLDDSIPITLVGKATLAEK